MVKFFCPETLEEALDVRGKKGAIPLAGGTDLMVRYENWSSLPPNFPGDVMGISQLKELRYIREEGDFLSIGSGMTMNEILDFPGIPRLLAGGLDEVAAPAVRNLATLAGNIANASPAADSLPPLAVMDAEIQLISPGGSRIVPVTDFITGPGKTILRKDELIESVRIPLSFIREEKQGRCFYRKVGTRKANALSKLSYCGWGLVEKGLLQKIRICIGGTAPVVIRLREKEDVLAGCPLGQLEERWSSVRGAYRERITPIDDQRSTAAYRKLTALKLLDYMISELASS
jgi:xanthine dehydrogenase FAD-binding subunit